MAAHPGHYPRHSDGLMELENTDVPDSGSTDCRLSSSRLSSAPGVVRWIKDIKCKRSEHKALVHVDKDDQGR